jgi:solute carrier family 25 protein 16
MYGWSSYGGVGSTMATIWRTEGILGFFRGNSATVARIMPYAAIQYSAFEFYNRALAVYVFTPESKSPAKRFIAGAMAGTTSVLCTYPIDLARTILAVRIGAHPVNVPTQGLWRTLVTVTAAEGAVGLYRGVYPTIVGVVPYSGISFLSYGLLKRVAEGREYWVSRPVTTSLVCGGSAGLSTYRRSTSQHEYHLKIQPLVIFMWTSGFAGP